MPLESPPAPLAATRPNYFFVDSVRFWSMLGVVAMHAIATVRSNGSEGLLPFAVLSVFKFGTIGFFVISGFLLGDRMETDKPFSYLTRRLRILLRPWAFWFLLYFAYQVGSDLSNQRFLATSAGSWIHNLSRDFVYLLFTGSSFWFVPNLALSLSILVLFRRHLHSVWLGLLLFGVNLIYVLDMYAGWFPTDHTTALFGYVSFLWLGTYAASNYNVFNRYMSRIPTLLFASLTFLAYVCSICEGSFMISHNINSSTNTLRFGNQLYALMVVLLLVKVKTSTWPSFIDVRRQTYGIYLTHMFFIRFAFAFVNRAFGHGLMDGLHPSVSFPLRAALFAFAYGGSLLLGRAILSSERWSWTLGVTPGISKPKHAGSNTTANVSGIRQNAPAT